MPTFHNVVQQQPPPPFQRETSLNKPNYSQNIDTQNQPNIINNVTSNSQVPKPNTQNVKYQNMENFQNIPPHKTYHFQISPQGNIQNSYGSQSTQNPPHVNPLQGVSTPSHMEEIQKLMEQIQHLMRQIQKDNVKNNQPQNPI